MPGPTLRETLRNGNIFGGETQDGLQASMQSTWDSLRNGPQQGPSIGEQNAFYNQPAPAAAPVAPAPVAPINPAFNAGNPFSMPGVDPVSAAAAGGLIVAGQQGQMAAYQDALKQAGVNLKPDQAPGDFALNHKNAKTIYDNIFRTPDTAGGTAPASGPVAPRPGSPGTFTGLPFGTPVTAYAPTDLRQRALGADGAPVTGFGGTQVTGTPGTVGDTTNPTGGSGWIAPGGLPLYQQTGAHFNLTQNPNTVPGAPGYVPRAAAPGAPAAAAAGPGAQSPFERNAAAVRAAQGGAAYEAPSGERFIRDANGRLQAAGSNPNVTTVVAGQKAGAEAEAKAGVEDAHKQLGEVGKNAEQARVQVAQIGRIQDLYANGATSGFGQDTLTKSAAALSRITGKDYNIGNQQQLEKELGKFVLDQASALSGQGQISDSERTAIQEAAANKTLSPQANMQILGVFKQIADRNIAMERERIRLDDAGVPPVQVAKEIRRLRDSMPINTENLGKAAAPVTVGKYKVTVH